MPSSIGRLDRRRGFCDLEDLVEVSLTLVHVDSEDDDQLAARRRPVVYSCLGQVWAK